MAINPAKQSDDLVLPTQSFDHFVHFFLIRGIHNEDSWLDNLHSMRDLFGRIRVIDCVDDAASRPNCMESKNIVNLSDVRL